MFEFVKTETGWVVFWGPRPEHLTQNDTKVVQIVSQPKLILSPDFEGLVKPVDDPVLLPTRV